MVAFQLKRSHLSWIVLVSCLVSSSIPQTIESFNNTIDGTRVASRRKRFIIFPKGSSFQLVYCFLTTAYGTDPLGIFTIGITIGLAWEIPQDPRPFIVNATKAFLTQGFLHRKHRRDLYPDIETFLDKYGVNGRSCILRAICESRQHTPGNGSFAEEIIHALFSLPEPEDQDDRIVYDEAEGHRQDECRRFHDACPSSILDLDFSGRRDPMSVPPPPPPHNDVT